MQINQDKVDEVALALLYLTLHGRNRVWKGLDWGVMDRLHEKGWIENPRNTNKSVVLTERGRVLAEMFQKFHFAQNTQILGGYQASAQAEQDEDSYTIDDLIYHYAEYETAKRRGNERPDRALLIAVLSERLKVSISQSAFDEAERRYRQKLIRKGKLSPDASLPLLWWSLFQHALNAYQSALPFLPRSGAPDLFITYALLRTLDDVTVALEASDDAFIYYADKALELMRTLAECVHGKCQVKVSREELIAAGVDADLLDEGL